MHNTQKIILNLGKRKILNYFYRVMLKRRQRLKRYKRRENHPSYISLFWYRTCSGWRRV